MEARAEKNLEFDRLVFFSDAVVAIAITLLALDLRLAHPGPLHLHWADVGAQWRSFAAFLLSFLNIAAFWRAHYLFFSHMRRADDRLLALNLGWLLFIVLLPFTTTLVSSYFQDRPAMLLYCANTLVIAVFQNSIWDYVCKHPAMIKEQALTRAVRYRLGLYCNLEMLNAAIAIGVTFLSPALGFLLLFTKIPTFVVAGMYYRHRQGRRFRDRRGRSAAVALRNPSEADPGGVS